MMTKKMKKTVFKIQRNKYNKRNNNNNNKYNNKRKMLQVINRWKKD